MHGVILHTAAYIRLSIFGPLIRGIFPVPRPLSVPVVRFLYRISRAEPSQVTALFSCFYEQHFGKVNLDWAARQNIA